MTVVTVVTLYFQLTSVSLDTFKLETEETKWTFCWVGHSGLGDKLGRHAWELPNSIQNIPKSDNLTVRSTKSGSRKSFAMNMATAAHLNGKVTG